MNEQDMKRLAEDVAGTLWPDPEGYAGACAELRAAAVKAITPVLARHLQGESAEMRVLTELLRLYDWRRGELAKEEKRVGRARERMAAHEVRPDGFRMSAGDFMNEADAIGKNIRKYGREKAAAWIEARRVLAARTPTDTPEETK